MFCNGYRVSKGSDENSGPRCFDSFVLTAMPKPIIVEAFEIHFVSFNLTFLKSRRTEITNKFPARQKCSIRNFSQFNLFIAITR